ncbi:hypothetical protein K9M48_00300 [Candidatus Gracilibacteria bacterium]|nr:hypothetical protein [Candidatus Gracilibacteria bacterium]
MFRQILRESINKITEDTKLIRLSFLVTFCHCISIVYLMVWNINNLLTYRYDKSISTGKALEYIINRSQDNNMTLWVIIFVSFVFLGYFLLYPVGESSLIHYLNDGIKKTGKALGKGINDFFVMFEFEALATTFSFFMYIITILRLFMLNILDNTFVIILVIIRGAAVLFATILRSYARFAIVIEGHQVFGAIKRSVYLTFLNFGTTIKFVFIQIFLTIRFLINAIVIMGVPFLIVYIAIWLNVIESKIVGYIIAISVIAMLILMAYINAIIEAFFVTYRYKVYKSITEEIKKEE